ncbi:MAG: fatty acid cis/trans isomerase [Gammaproteobacteria bacterium]|nr:fatty acid cis/trans isomerase [Gammaproteobacteria bacterium]
MRISFLRFFTGTLVAALVACAPSPHSLIVEQDQIEYDLLYTLPKEQLSFNNDVMPILEKRCIACHGCYDAPCQLKLTSAEGIERGSNKTKVYNGTRITADSPTRLFIDAVTTEEWRGKNFHPVLHEKNADEPNSPVDNLKNSVLYHMLRLKQLRPQARTGTLSDKFDLSLDRKQSCPTIDEFSKYARDYPEGGMPYAMPNISRNEYTTLVHWIAQGSPVEDPLPPSKEIAKQIDQWETLLNGTSKKEKLFSRYIYEHLFHAHIYFKDSDQQEFYELVRSTTPPGDKVDIIPTVRPYNNPGDDVFYRIVKYRGTIVEKTHLPYEFSGQRMQRYKELFIDADYEITSLPSYDPKVASNPIKAFADIPVNSRYRFLLDDARFFIAGFIKGPVCRGQVALNVIEDQFWVAFIDPDAPVASSDDKFLKENADAMALPSEVGNTLRLLSVSRHYKGLFQDYMGKRDEVSKLKEPIDLTKAMDYIWDGDGHTNKNAALTIFRHFDSASVNNGWLGDYPETTWLMDYSILERMHYLLVAGFDVYGNVGHQLVTRLYTDLLRSEGEHFFLAFLPVEKRKQLITEWYRGMRESDRDDASSLQWLDRELVNGYKTDDEQRELYETIATHLGPLSGDGDFINRCHDNKCIKPEDKNILRVNTTLRSAKDVNKKLIQYSANVAFIRVLMGGKPEDDLAYSVIYNKAYLTVSNMLQTEKPGEGRDYSSDSQTILPWLEGSYPNVFMVVKLDEIETFMKQYDSIRNHQDYEVFVSNYAIRRTNEDFWHHADWFNEHHKRERPILSGIFDLSRYQNR